MRREAWALKADNSTNSMPHARGGSDGTRGLFGLDLGLAHHASPLFKLLLHEGAEFGRRELHDHGTEIAANSPPDGYTLTVVSIANALQPALYKLPYNPHKAFDAVAMFVTSPNTLAVNPDVPAKTLMEFVAYVKSKPGDVHYASGGIGGSLHLGMELFKLVTKTDMVHVPFKGAGPAMIDVIAGNTKATVATTSSLSTHMRSGKLRGLAVSTPKRIAALPDLPTFIEAGLPEYEGGNWIGFAVPAGTPKPVIEKLHKEIAAIQDMPEVQQQFLNRGAEVVKMTPAQFQAYIEREMAKWGDVVKQAGIKAQ